MSNKKQWFKQYDKLLTNYIRVCLQVHLKEEQIAGIQKRRNESDKEAIEVMRKLEKENDELRSDCSRYSADIDAAKNEMSRLYKVNEKLQNELSDGGTYLETIGKQSEELSRLRLQLEYAKEQVKAYSEKLEQLANSPDEKHEQVINKLGEDNADYKLRAEYSYKKDTLNQFISEDEYSVAPHLQKFYEHVRLLF